jgi:HEAT repeats
MALINGADNEQVAAHARRMQLLGVFSHLRVEMLITALSDPHRQILAAEALGALKDGRAFDPLFELLVAPDPATRKAAAKALGELRDPRAAEGLFIAIRDEDYAVRLSASEALDRLGSAAIIMGMGVLFRSMALTLETEAGGDRKESPLLEQGIEAQAEHLGTRSLPGPERGQLAASTPGPDTHVSDPRPIRRIVAELIERYRGAAP